MYKQRIARLQQRVKDLDTVDEEPIEEIEDSDDAMSLVLE